MKKFSVLLIGILVFALFGCARKGGGASGRLGESDSLVVIPAAPERGFNYPYVLRFPATTTSPTPTFLVVEPNNTGKISDDLVVHVEAARHISTRAIGAFVASMLKLPLLVPAFPRPETEWRIYTHLLDRDTILIDEGPMRRLDLQLLAMVEDAGDRLAEVGLPIERKILLTGFSASGGFSNRFTMLHPERVQAVAAGGVNGLLMLPISDLSDARLPYPLGVADYESVAGRPFDLTVWRQVPQFIYMGAEDDNDAVRFDDGYSDTERATVFATLGERMQPDRWEKCQDIYRAAGAAVTFRTYPGIGHGTNRSINSEIAEFFRASMNAR